MPHPQYRYKLIIRSLGVTSLEAAGQFVGRFIYLSMKSRVFVDEILVKIDKLDFNWEFRLMHVKTSDITWNFRWLIFLMDWSNMPKC